MQVPLKMKTTITMGPANGVHVSKLLRYVTKTQRIRLSGTG